MSGSGGTDGGGLTQKETAERLEITPRQLRRIPDEYTGRLEDGSYPWPETLHGYVRWKQSEILKRKGHESRPPEVDSERAERLALQNWKLALEIAELEGSLIPVDIHERRCSEFAESVNAALRSIRTRWASEIVGISDVKQAQQVLASLVNDLLTELAGHGSDGSDTSSD